MRPACLLVVAALAATACGEDRETSLPAQRPSDFTLTYEDRSAQHKRHLTLRLVGDKAELIDHTAHPSVVRELRLTAAQIAELYDRLRKVKVDTIRMAAKKPDEKADSEVAVAIRWGNNAVSLRDNAREGPAKADEERFVIAVGHMLAFVEIWRRDAPR